MVLPIVIALTAVVLSFFGVSAAAIVFPQVSAFIFAIAFGILAWLTKDLVFYDTGKWKFSGGLFFGCMAALVMVATFLGITIPQFGASFVSIAGSISPASVESDGALAWAASAVQFLGVEPMSLTVILTVIVATLALVFVADKMTFKGKLLRRK